MWVLVGLLGLSIYLWHGTLSECLISGSSLKGALKSSCLREYCPGREYNCCELLYGWDIRVRGGAPDEPWVSPVLFTDALLFLYPARFEGDSGVWYGYVTSWLQLARVADLIGVGVDDLVSNITSDQNNENRNRIEFVNGIAVGEGMLSQRRLNINWDNIANRGLLPAGVLRLLNNGVYIVEGSGADTLFQSIVEAGLIRQARVRLDPVRKVVEHGALWTEEHVPDHAVFVFANYYRDTRIQGYNLSACQASSDHLEVLGRMGGLLWVGGKESVGRGLTRIIRLTNYINNGGNNRGEAQS